MGAMQKERKEVSPGERSKRSGICITTINKSDFTCRVFENA